MRVLILTHPRSGGFSLLSWISRELNCESCHEPFAIPEDLPGQLARLDNPHICVKADISHLQGIQIGIHSFVSGFDLVLFHVRWDLRAAAISRARQLVAGESHEVYALDGDWIDSHQEEIAKAERELMAPQNAILHWAGVFKQGLLTSYEGIYQTGVDVPRICASLGISDPQWTDIIHPSRRLQNGTLLGEPGKKNKFI